MDEYTVLIMPQNFQRSSGLLIRQPPEPVAQNIIQEDSMLVPLTCGSTRMSQTFQ